MKNIVTFGGANGTGLVMRGLKRYRDQYNLSAIVSMSDSGRSSGKIREEIGSLPPADILRVLLSMSTRYEYDLLKELFYSKRFTGDDKLERLNIGSLLIALTSQYLDGDILTVIRNLERIFETAGNVYPACLDQTHINVQLQSGKTIHGEGNIDEPGAIDRTDLIEKIWLEPSGNIYKEAAAALRKADVIITGPGDLYTSNITAILPNGAKEAIAESNAKIIYVAGNKFTIDGEPAPTSLSARVRALEQYLPRKVDAIFYDSHKLSEKEKTYYQEKHWGLLDFDVEQLAGYLVVGKDIEEDGGGIDTSKLGDVLYDIIENLV